MDSGNEKYHILCQKEGCASHSQQERQGSPRRNASQQLHSENPISLGSSLEELYIDRWRLGAMILEFRA